MNLSNQFSLLVLTSLLTACGATFNGTLDVKEGQTLSLRDQDEEVAPVTFSSGPAKLVVSAGMFSSCSPELKLIQGNKAVTFELPLEEIGVNDCRGFIRYASNLVVPAEKIGQDYDLKLNHQIESANDSQYSTNHNCQYACGSYQECRDEWHHGHWVQRCTTFTRYCPGTYRVDYLVSYEDHKFTVDFVNVASDLGQSSAVLTSNWTKRNQREVYRSPCR